MNEGKIVIDNESATQEQVEKAKNDMEKVLKALREKSTGSSHHSSSKSKVESEENSAKIIEAKPELQWKLIKDKWYLINSSGEVLKDECRVLVYIPTVIVKAPNNLNKCYFCYTHI